VTGLAAGLTLRRHDVDTVVVESANAVGGLARTLTRNGFRFDLGGHRFFTKNESINRFIDDLMGDEMINVVRKSSIFYDGKFFDYPLRTSNVLMNLGVANSLKVVSDYAWTRTKRMVHDRPTATVEDWMIDQFGETLYKIFFQSYTAKVWGLPANQLSQEWAGQRIRGFSLTTAIKHALFKSSKSRPKTLIDKFTYPRMGIGRICERMAEEIERYDNIYLNSPVSRLNHEGRYITSAEFDYNGAGVKVMADNFISSMPLTAMLGLMNPEPPRKVMDAAAAISFRGLIVVHLAIDRERLNDQTWIYIQEPSSIVSRIHEPKNWSEDLVPKGKTSLVVEIPSSPGEALWSKSNDEIAKLAINSIEKEMKFAKASEILDAYVIRLPKAYPVYHLGYEEKLNVLLDYVRGFKNLQTVGRAGLHKYANIDHCLECGILAAKNTFGASYDLSFVNSEREYLEEAAS
jgi:protoporphyrinogen oxidase